MFQMSNCDAAAAAAAVVRVFIGQRLRIFGRNDPLGPLLFPMLLELERLATPHRDMAEEAENAADAQWAERLRYDPPNPPGV